MPTNKHAIPQAIYQIKVTLLGTRQPVWRRLLAPSDMTLDELHDALQVAMGWEESHMHDFRIGQRRFGKPDPNETLMGLPATANERTTRLFSVLGKVGARAVYTYDFGDGWEHQIVVEKMLAPEPGHTYPPCIAGKRHCLPEDCGGVWGFYSLLEALKDPEHDQHEEARDCLGDDFDPEAFSIDEANRRLSPLQWRAK